MSARAEDGIAAVEMIHNGVGDDDKMLRCSAVLSVDKLADAKCASATNSIRPNPSCKSTLGGYITAVLS